VLEKFNGEVPKTMDELLTLAGVGFFWAFFM